MSKKRTSKNRSRKRIVPSQAPQIDMKIEGIEAGGDVSVKAKITTYVINYGGTSFNIILFFLNLGIELSHYVSAGTQEAMLLCEDVANFFIDHINKIPLTEIKSAKNNISCKCMDLFKKPNSPEIYGYKALNKLWANHHEEAEELIKYGKSMSIKDASVKISYIQDQYLNLVHGIILCDNQKFNESKAVFDKVSYTEFLPVSQSFLASIELKKGNYAEANGIAWEVLSRYLTKGNIDAISVNPIQSKLYEVAALADYQANEPESADYAMRSAFNTTSHEESRIRILQELFCHNRTNVARELCKEFLNNSRDIITVPAVSGQLQLRDTCVAIISNQTTSVSLGIDHCNREGANDLVFDYEKTLLATFGSAFFTGLTFTLIQKITSHVLQKSKFADICYFLIDMLLYGALIYVKETSLNYLSGFLVVLSILGDLLNYYLGKTNPRVQHGQLLHVTRGLSSCFQKITSLSFLISEPKSFLVTGLAVGVGQYSSHKLLSLFGCHAASEEQKLVEKKSSKNSTKNKSYKQRSCCVML
jgi:hypothetical protein